MSIITAAVSGGIGALIAGIFALINRHLDKKDAPITARFDAITKRLDKNEKDNVRTQLLLLLSDYPDDKSEIMEVARHYFIDLKGDWYMTSIFNKWIKKVGAELPDWFDPKK